MIRIYRNLSIIIYPITKFGESEVVSKKKSIDFDTFRDKLQKEVLGHLFAKYRDIFEYTNLSTEHRIFKACREDNLCNFTFSHF